MRISRAGAFVSGVVVAVLVGGGTAVASGGTSVLLGHSNASAAVTSLVNKAGPALSLGSKAGTSPLTVGSAVKVKNLNSDLLDGKSAAEFLAADGTAADATLLAGRPSSAYLNNVYSGATMTELPVVSNGLDTTTVPAGSYLVSANVDFHNADSTLGGFGCYAQYWDGTTATRGSYADATVLKYASASLQEVRTFTTETTVSLNCVVSAGDQDGKSTIDTSSLVVAPVQLSSAAMPSVRTGSKVLR
jgi:hypothetical protein